MRKTISYILLNTKIQLSYFAETRIHKHVNHLK